MKLLFGEVYKKNQAMIIFQ